MSISRILDQFNPSSYQDSVAIFDQNFNQLFRQARTIKATVKEQSKVMQHPVETGAIISDHVIILPVEIDLSLILSSIDYQEVYRNIRQYYLNSTLLVVQTKSGIYTNQLISSLPHEEDPSQYDALSVALSLRQVIIVTAKYGIAPKSKKHTSRSNRGTQQAKPASKETTTLATDITGKGA